MKKKYYFMALATLMMGACSEDTGLEGGGGNSSLPAIDGRTELKFTLSGLGGGVVPYAPVATEAENELQTLDVFVFNRDTLPDGTPKADADGKVNYHLEEIFKFGTGGTALGDAGSNKTASITINGDNMKYFYFVANARISGQEIASLSEYELNKTDTAAFFASLTNRLGSKLICPLVMSATREFNLKDSVANNKTGPYTIDLKRVVARFDINNVAKDSKFYIHSIKIKHARRQAFIFPHDTTYMPAEGLTDLDPINFLDLPEANIGTTRSAFYMYPSPVADDAFLELTGTTDAAGLYKLTYPVKFQKVQDKDAVNDVPIVANNYYVLNLKAVGVNEIDATLTVQDWGKNDTVNSAGGYGSMLLTLDPTEARTDVSLNKNTLNLPAETFVAPGDSAVKILVQADSKWEIETTSVPDWLEVTLGDETDGVAKELTVKAKTSNANGDDARIARVILKNSKRPSITQTLIVQQATNTENFIKLVAEGLYDGVLNVTGRDMTPSSADGVQTIKVAVTSSLATAASDWTADVTGTDGTGTPDWIALTQEAAPAGYSVTGASGSLLVLTIQPNPTLDPRSAMVTLQVDADHKRSFIVTQAKQSLGSIDISGSQIENITYTRDAETGNITLDMAGSVAIGTKGYSLKVKATSAWKVTVPAEATWITVPAFETDALTDGRFYIEIPRNDTKTTRSAVLVVENTLDNTIKKEVTINQSGDIYVIADNLVEETAAAVSVAKTIAVTTNADAITAEKSADSDWLTVNVNGKNIEYTVTENTTFATRTATVTVTGDADEASKKEITFTQAAATLVFDVKEGNDNTGTAVSGALTDIAQDDTTTEQQVYVDTNGAWTATKDDAAGWLDINPATGSAAAAIAIKANATNDAAEDRTATVTITSDVDGSKTVSFTVTQKGTGAI